MQCVVQQVMYDTPAIKKKLEHLTKKRNIEIQKLNAIKVFEKELKNSHVFTDLMLKGLEKPILNYDNDTFEMIRDTFKKFNI